MLPLLQNALHKQKKKTWTNIYIYKFTHIYKLWVKKYDFSLQFRDDNKKLHPCLVDFQSLPEPEKNYNLQMSAETLKWVAG